MQMDLENSSCGWKWLLFQQCKSTLGFGSQLKLHNWPKQTTSSRVVCSESKISIITKSEENQNGKSLIKLMAKSKAQTHETNV